MSVKRDVMIGAGFARLRLDGDNEASIELLMSVDGGRTKARLKASTLHPDQLADLAAAATTIERLQRSRRAPISPAAETSAA